MIAPDVRDQGRGGTVLVVDDDEPSAALVSRFLTRARYDVQIASSGEAALEAVASQSPDTVVLDVMMPGISGFEVCRRLKSGHATRLIPVVLVTVLDDRSNRLEGINTGADDYLTKPVDAAELTARVRSLVNFKRYIDRMDSAAALFVSLALTIEARDRYTVGHCQRLARLASRLGLELGLPHDQLEQLHLGGYLHDLGKVGVPDAVLLKQGRLTPAEREVMESHTFIGDSICSRLRSLAQVRPIVRSHHEHLDGSGYPDGLVGDQIPLLAQIMSIVDMYDALRTDRPYRAAISPHQAWAALRAEVQRGWRQPELVEAFIALDRDHKLRASAPSARTAWSPAGRIPGGKPH